MREIKFRVFNTDSKKWIKNLTYCIDDFSATNKDWHKVMQYTGLKDRNGKEVYEGDICICPRNGQVCDTPLIVKYGGQCQFYLQEVGTDKIFNMPMFAENIEVIGNIYEHTELLNQ